MSTPRRRSAPCLGALLALAAAVLLFEPALAHPGSGIALDPRGQVYFIDSGQGVWRIDAAGRLTLYDDTAYHWMALDVAGRFAGVLLPKSPTSDMRAVGSDPTVVVSSDVPVVVGRDGALYYPELGPGEVLRVIRHAGSGSGTVLVTLAPASAGGPRWLNGIAAGPDGSIYYTLDRGVRRIDPQGGVATMADQVEVPDCVHPPTYDGELGPHLRGLDVDAQGNVWVAATACSALLKITPAGLATPVLRAESPWSPTAVVVSTDAAYVLEYLHVPTDDRRDWLPRVRKLMPDGSVTIVAAVERQRRP